MCTLDLAWKEELSYIMLMDIKPLFLESGYCSNCTDQNVQEFCRKNLAWFKTCVYCLLTNCPTWPVENFSVAFLQNILSMICLRSQAQVYKISCVVQNFLMICRVSLANKSASCFIMSNQLGASGYLTGKPGLLSTASDTGCLQRLAGISSAMINTWRFMFVSGSSVQTYIGKGISRSLIRWGL